MREMNPLELVSWLVSSLYYRTACPESDNCGLKRLEQSWQDDSVRKGLAVHPDDLSSGPGACMVE